MAVKAEAIDNHAVTRREFDPYGNPLGTVHGGPWPDQHGFLDKPHNPVTGLTDIGARTYDPALGRFLSVDPILDPADPQQWNPYNYSNNNPTTFADPSGLRPAGCEEFHMNCRTDGPQMASKSDPAGQAYHNDLRAKVSKEHNAAHRAGKPAHRGRPLNERELGSWRANGYQGSPVYTWADAVEWAATSNAGFDQFCQGVLGLPLAQ